MRRIALCLLVLAVAAAGVGCGDDGGPPLTAEEFAAQGNAICKAGDAKLAQEGQDLLKNPNTPADEITKFYLKHAVPNARYKLKEIGKLNPPVKDRDKVKKMLSAGKRATDAVEDGLEKQGTAFRQGQAGTELFKVFDDLARELNLNDCATPK